MRLTRQTFMGDYALEEYNEKNLNCVINRYGELEDKLENCGWSFDELKSFLQNLSTANNIENLDISVRTLNILKRQNIKTISELESLSNEEIKRIRCIGAKGYKEILKALNRKDN